MQVGKSKIGRFLFFIGLILLVVFFAVDQSAHPTYGYFCAGVVVLLLGGLLMFVAKNRRPMKACASAPCAGGVSNRKSERRKEIKNLFRIEIP